MVGEDVEVKVDDTVTVGVAVREEVGVIVGVGDEVRVGVTVTVGVGVDTQRYLFNLKYWTAFPPPVPPVTPQ